MSPEQAAGEGAVTTASDVYAFGVVGFEMLTGRLPFEAASLAGMLIKHAAEEAPRVERFRPDCPPVLADIVARCLAKHPADRWSGMNQIGEALATLPMEPARGLQRFLTRWWPLIDRRTARSSMVSRFRILCGSFVLVNVALFLFDLRDGVLDFAPPLLLLLGFFLAGQYGSLRHAGFSWRDLLHSGKHRVPPSD
jgi:serine/threonine protein kinase